MTEGAGKIKQFALAFIIASFVWLLHNLSEDYSSYLQYRVRLSTDIEGYESTALSNEILLLRGKASGFYILKMRSRKHTFTEIDLVLDHKYLTPVKGEEGIFSVKVSDITEKIDEAVDDMAIDFIETERLTFNLKRQSYKKVPVVLASDIKCLPQYMIVGDIEVWPDSIVVYGNTKDLEGVHRVTTRTVSLERLDKSVQGVVALERLDGFRVDVDEVHYSFDVKRYVEHSKVVPVTVQNMPFGKNLMILPSSVTVTYRTPVRASVQDFSLVVDYQDYIKAASSKAIPKMVGGGRDILSYEIDPKMVECISIAD